MANRTVTVRYVLDATSYRAGASSIKAVDRSIADSARAAAAAADRATAGVTRNQQKATQAFVTGGKAQADAQVRVAKATTASTRIQEDASRRIVRVQEDAAQKLARAKTEQARQEIVSQSTLRQARIREDAEVRSSRAAQESSSKAAAQASREQARQATATAKASAQAQAVQQRAAESSIKAQLRDSQQASRAAAQVSVQEARATAQRARTVEQAARGQQRLEVQQIAADRRAASAAKTAANERRAAFNQSAASATQVGHSALLTGGLIAAGLGLSARAAIQWQSDFTGVTKTVSGSQEQLNALGTELRGLSRTMPETSTQIAGVAEAAGQLGIQTPSIAAFTKTMVQLGDTTNLTSDEAATSLAQFGNIMGTLKGPPDEVNDNISRIGATIVGLGNNGASTEKQITDMGLRIASAGKTIGLSGQSVLGFASAVASTGVEAEAGGTAVTNSFLKIDAAVRKGGKGLDLLAQTSGKSADEFKRAYSQDSAGAITDFVEGLGGITSKGGDANAVLRQLGITGVREGTVLRNLAGAGSLLRDNLKGANDAYASNTALTAEAAKRYETDASRIQIAVNKIKDDAIDIGGATLPIVSGITDKVSQYADAFKGLSAGQQGAVVKTAGISAGVLLVGGAALSAAGSVATLVSNLKNLGLTSGGVKSVAGALGAVGLAVAAAEVAGSIYDKVGSQKGQTNNQDAVTRSLQAYSVAAAQGKQASLDLTSALPSPNKFNAIAIAIGADTVGATDFNDALQSATSGGVKGFVFGMEGLIQKIQPGQQATERINDAITKVDGSLTSLVQNGHADQAAASFAEIAKQNSNIAPEKLVGKFSSYANAVRNATDVNGYHIASDQDLVDIMGGKIPPALAAAAKKNKELAGAVNAVTGANIATTKTIEEQFASIQKNTSGILGLRSAHNDLEAAIDAGAASAKANGKTLDVNTAKGRANRQALDNVAIATANYVAQQKAQGKNDLQIVEANERGRQSYIKLAESLGQSGKKARSDAADAFKLPKELRTTVAVDVKGASKNQIHDLNKDIQKLPKEKRAKIVAIAEDKGLKAARTAIKDLTDKPHKTKVKTEYEKGKPPPAPKPIKQKILQQFSTEAAPKPKTLTQKIKQVVSGPDDVGGALDSKKSRTITFNSKVNAPKAPKAPKGQTITYKSKVDAPKAPKPPKGATITYKVKVDKTAKVPVPKGGTVKIKTDVDLSGVRRAKSGISGVKGKSVSIKTSANLSGVRSVRSAINSLPNSKTVTITTVKREVTKKAGGGAAFGKIIGPGTDTSDSIDAKLSRDEWVIKARSSRYYGDSIMDALNMGAIPKSALQPYAYATGGKAGLPASPAAFAKGGKVTITQLLNAITNDNPLQDVEDAKKGSKAWKEALKEAAKAVRDFGKTLTDQFTSSSTSGADQLALQQQGITDLSALQAKIDKLQSLGLDDTQIAAIVKRASEGDVAGASALADSIIDGGKGLVDQLNKAAKSLADIANMLAADTQTKKVRGYAGGGQATGPGTATSDTAGLFALSNREWVHPVASVDYYGEAFMAAVQNRTLPRARVSGYMAQGGQVGVKVVTAPSSTGDFVRALQGATFQIQNPWGPGYMEAKVAAVADQRIDAAFTTAGSGR